MQSPAAQARIAQVTNESRIEKGNSFAICDLLGFNAKPPFKGDPHMGRCFLCTEQRDTDTQTYLNSL